MDAKSFFLLVRELRTNQKEYFKTRSRSALEKSKMLEKRIDDEITRVENLVSLPNYTTNQPGLFDK